MAIVPLAESLGPDAADLADVADVNEMYVPALAAVLTFLFLLAFAATRVVRGYRLQGEKGKNFLRLSFVQAAVFVAAGALPLIVGFDLQSTNIVSVLIALALAAGRVLSMIRDHRPLSVIASSIAILVIILCALSFLSM